MFDITLFPINLEHGVEQNSLPGLVVLPAPRKTARGRENDVVLALVHISGSSGIAASSLNNWLTKKIEGYFQTAGTVTFAMKSLVETLNNDLLERNLKRVKDGTRMSAALNLAVVKRGSLYLVTVGPAKAWFASKSEALEFMDVDNQGRGLGVDQNLVCKFSTCELTENDIFVISCQPPEIWKADTFNHCGTLSNEVVSRRMFNQTGTELRAVLFRFTNGKGQIKQMALPGHTSTPSISEKATPSASEPSIAAAAEPVSSVKVDQLASQKLESIPVAAPILPEEAAFIGGSTQEAERIISQPATSVTLRRKVGGRSHRAEYQTEKPQEEKPEKPSIQTAAVVSSTEMPSTSQDPAQPRTVEESQDEESSTETGKFSFAKLIHKLLPGFVDESLKLNTSTLIAIAIAVPLFIALLAGAVYARTGKTKQFNQNLILAQQYAIQAETQTNNPPLYLASLQQSMYWLDKAESYGQTDTSASLRVKVQGELDILQGVQRLEMEEVIPGGLPAGSVVTHMIATATDLYLLDGPSGMVKHYSMGSSGYEKDEKFDCGPNPDNPLNTLGKLVDMVPVDVNNTFKATLMAVDASGNTEFCIPGEAGVTSGLTPPDQGWKNLSAITIFNNYLYILDTGGNAVYRYEGDGIQFETKPTLFFDNQIPDLTQAIDIEVNGDELYILRSNGEMVECTYSHMKDYKLTECQDPAPYGDMRTGEVPESISFPEAKFIQMRLTSAPDSSLYVLDATAKALYHFSLQRNLQKILHPRFMDGVNLDRVAPTSLTVSSARIVFIAFGSQIYYASLP